VPVPQREVVRRALESPDEEGKELEGEAAPVARGADLVPVEEPEEGERHAGDDGEPMREEWLDDERLQEPPRRVPGIDRDHRQAGGRGRGGEREGEGDGRGSSEAPAGRGEDPAGEEGADPEEEREPGKRRDLDLGGGQSTAHAEREDDHDA
jgi:hypothetical protein